MAHVGPQRHRKKKRKNGVDNNNNINLGPRLYTVLQKTEYLTDAV
jgi:hypothetical protein